MQNDLMISTVWGFYAAVCDSMWGFYAAVYKIKNISKFWINLVVEAFSAQVSFGSYLNSLFKTTIVSFILQFLTHNSPEHGCDALNCTL